MNKFPSLVRRLAKLQITGNEILKTHHVLTRNPPWNCDPLHRLQERRIEEFEKNMIRLAKEWRQEDLDKYWTGH